jgi:type VII secretion-associated serine protease mycosin
MRAAGLAVAVCLALAPAAVVSAPAQAHAVRAPACKPQQGAPKLSGKPWPQTRFDYDRLWKVTKGAGVTVAVVDTGVDGSHPQLSGRVTSIDVTKTTTRDCLGHGTEVTGIIAAKDMRNQNRPFVGIAPEAKILSVKYTNEQHSSGADPNLAKAIRAAAGAKGVKVINVSSTSPDTPELRSAVEFAQSRDILVVAAAGNITDEEQGKEVPAYPAGYNGVIGVASADQNGQISDFSNERTQIAVAAPGKDIPTTWPGGAYNPAANGTSYAAPFVAGLAALVRARFPDLNYKQVANRILVTAEGTSGLGSGRGMVNPLDAVTAEISDSAPPSAASNNVVQPVRIDPPKPADTRTSAVALTITFATLLVAALVAIVGAVIPMGRRRGWKPGRVDLPRE